jgi:hypothetical protein
MPVLLGVTLASEGKLAQSEAELARIRPRLEKAPPAYTTGLFVELAEGIVVLKRGNAAQAEGHFRGALGIAGKQAGGKNYGVALSSRWLASALEAEGQISAARAAADDSIRIWSQIYPGQTTPLQEARAYATKLSRQLPGAAPVP